MSDVIDPGNPGRLEDLMPLIKSVDKPGLASNSVVVVEKGVVTGVADEVDDSRNVHIAQTRAEQDALYARVDRDIAQMENAIDRKNKSDEPRVKATVAGLEAQEARQRQVEEEQRQLAEQTQLAEAMKQETRAEAARQKALATATEQAAQTAVALQQQREAQEAKNALLEQGAGVGRQLAAVFFDGDTSAVMQHRLDEVVDAHRAQRGFIVKQKVSDARVDVLGQLNGVSTGTEGVYVNKAITHAAKSMRMDRSDLVGDLGTIDHARLLAAALTRGRGLDIRSLGLTALRRDDGEILVKGAIRGYRESQQKWEQTPTETRSQVPWFYPTEADINK